MEQASVDDIVLRWLGILQGVPRESRRRVLRHACDSLASCKDVNALRTEADDLLDVVESSPDPAEMRQAACSAVRECYAATIEEQLTPWCALILRCVNSPGAVRRLSSAQSVAAELAAQNTSAAEHWRSVGDLEVWMVPHNPRSVGVRSVFAAKEKTIKMSFQDEVDFDVCGRIERVVRTLLVDHPWNADEVRAMLHFGDKSAS